MKNNVKNYLSLSALVAASAFMVSCDDDNTTLLSTPSADELEAAKNKPVAPVPLALYPLTSLKLSFNSAGGDCLGSAFEAGDELELDFDSTTAVRADDVSGDAVADLGFDGFTVFGPSTIQGFVQGIQNFENQFTIANVYANGATANGNLILSNLVFTPLGSDLRSITGSFTATAPVGIAFNQDTRNVVGTGSGFSIPVFLPSGDFVTASSITIYEDAGPGGEVEVQSLDGLLNFESQLQPSNYGVSVVVSGGGDTCTINFSYAKATLEGLVARADIADGIGIDGGGAPNAEAGTIIATLNLNNSLDVSPPGNQIPASSPPLYLTAGAGRASVTGSYRHDFDSSFGTAETIINSSAEEFRGFLGAN